MSGSSLVIRLKACDGETARNDLLQKLVPHEFEVLHALEMLHVLDTFHSDHGKCTAIKHCLEFSESSRARMCMSIQILEIFIKCFKLETYQKYVFLLLISCLNKDTRLSEIEHLVKNLWNVDENLLHKARRQFLMGKDAEVPIDPFPQTATTAIGAAIGATATPTTTTTTTTTHQQTKSDIKKLSQTASSTSSKRTPSKKGKKKVSDLSVRRTCLKIVRDAEAGTTPSTMLPIGYPAGQFSFGYVFTQRGKRRPKEEKEREQKNQKNESSSECRAPVIPLSLPERPEASLRLLNIEAAHHGAKYGPETYHSDDETHYVHGLEWSKLRATATEEELNSIPEAHSMSIAECLQQTRESARLTRHLGIQRAHTENKKRRAETDTELESDGDEEEEEEEEYYVSHDRMTDREGRMLIFRAPLQIEPFLPDTSHVVASSSSSSSSSSSATATQRRGRPRSVSDSTQTSGGKTSGITYRTWNFDQ